MTLRAVYFDFGGVLVRTEDPAPRNRLAGSLGLSSRDIERVVFEGRSAEQAALGAISEEQHWQNVVDALRLPEDEVGRVHDEFFGGDIWDDRLYAFLRAVRKTAKTGLISNAWTGLRQVIVGHNFDDAFDTMIISAEVGMVKPGAGIFHYALEKLGVQPQEAAFVDDVAENVAAAQELGMHAIQFTRTQPVLDELKQFLSNHR
jgi:epoxide hydrolase-like predicted phosphatase